MGRRKEDALESPTYIPKISDVSRKIAGRRLKSLDCDVPHFMRDIKCRTSQPLAPIPINEDKLNASSDSSDTNEAFLEQLLSPKLSERSLKLSKDKNFSLRTGKMAKSDVLLDDNIFTFKPKVSTASAKIVENLGTDFMARQQQHLERQKRHVSGKCNSEMLKTFWTCQLFDVILKSSAVQTIR